MEGELAVNDIPFSRVLAHVPVQFLGYIDGSVSVICYAVVMTLCYCFVPLYTPRGSLGALLSASVRMLRIRSVKGIEAMAEIYSPEGCKFGVVCPKYQFNHFLTTVLTW